jgi:hypothetical protein
MILRIRKSWSNPLYGLFSLGAYTARACFFYLKNLDGEKQIYLNNYLLFSTIIVKVYVTPWFKNETVNPIVGKKMLSIFSPMSSSS